MLQQISVATAQGAGATTASFMPNSPKPEIGHSPNSARISLFRHLLTLACFLLLTSSTGFSQEIVNQPLSQYGFEITAPDQLLQAGETATFDVQLHLPIQDAIEFSVALELGPAAAPPHASNLGFSATWFPAGTPVLTLQPDQVEALIQPSPAVSGSGILFQITLEATQNNVPARDLIATGGGHVLVVIEDVGFKQAPVGEPSFTLYPNPCHRQVNFKWDGAAPTELRLYNQLGMEVARIDQSVLESGQWTLPSLPAGRYHAVLEGAPQLKRHHTLWLR